MALHTTTAILGPTRCFCFLSPSPFLLAHFDLICFGQGSSFAQAQGQKFAERSTFDFSALVKGPNPTNPILYSLFRFSIFLQSNLARPDLRTSCHSSLTCLSLATTSQKRKPKRIKCPISRFRPARHRHQPPTKFRLPNLFFFLLPLPLDVLRDAANLSIV